MGLITLVWRNLWRRWLRTLLTVASITVAVFLLCLLRTLVTTLNAGADVASSRRLVVQSAVSLFVDLPLAYQTKMESVPGVSRVMKWQWFGGYYQNERNRFAQFAIDPENLIEVYPEMEIISGSMEGFLANRRGCIVGERLVERWKDEGWEIGGTVPLIGDIFPHPDGSDVPWEFEIEAIYRPTLRNFDAGMFFFHWDYFEKTVEAGPFGTPGVGTFVVELEDPNDATAVMAGIDGLFENGPQRVQATSEAEFNKQFVSMMGNIPFFVSTIGGGVLAAILLAVVNTMLMAGREQTRDLGILKALGFGDGAARRLLVAQSLALCLLGAVLGLGLAKLSEGFLALAMSTFFPGYHVVAETYLLGAAIAVGIGLVAGIVPALRAGKLRPVEALSTEE